MSIARPFLKWAGGKQQLLEQFEPFLPTQVNRYIEPFMGGGALFFHLHNSQRLKGQSYLFDNNAELVITYQVVRDQVDALIAQLADHEQAHSPEHYYQIRSLDRTEQPMDIVTRAARMVYLNHVCYNGLYRVNKRGYFNVPLGRYAKPKALYETTLRIDSAALQGVQIGVQNFRQVLAVAQAGDFIYFDPPYDPVSKTANFTSYTSGNFGDDDQRDLAAIFAELVYRGCHCMLSNSYTPFVLELYRGFRIEIVHANRLINSRQDGRGVVQEVVVIGR